MFGFFGGGGMPGGTFEAHYRAMPVAFIDKQSAEFGDKVILPPSALDRLASLHIEYPMLFKVESTAGRVTHCGVLEFVAEEGVVYMPHWMMQNMLLQVGDMVKFKNVSLPKGTYVKLQPVTSDFLDISNPKAVLERTLRSYTCLTVGDCFVVNYNNRNYEIEVKEAKPGRAISVVETDCQVDFEAPKDYKEPQRVTAPPATSKQDKAQETKASGSGSAGKPSPEPEAPAAAAGTTYMAFAGTARRLDGRPAVSPAAPVPVTLGNKTGSSSSLLAAGASKGSPAASNGAAASGSGTKAGTFVSTGNRLLDKLAREKMEKTGAAAPPAAAPPATASPTAKPGEQPATDAFKPFAGKGYSLKG